MNDTYASALKAQIIIISFVIFFITGAIFTVVSCTLSLQNVSTHGTATDLIDEEQAPTDNISPNISTSQI